MDQKQIVKQMMEFNKTAFDNAFNAIVMIQDQAEKMVSDTMEKTTWFPEEGKKAIRELANSYKKAREDFKTASDENYKKIGDYFAGITEDIIAKAGKK